jgi:hypothetical protein
MAIGTAVKKMPGLTTLSPNLPPAGDHQGQGYVGQRVKFQNSVLNPAAWKCLSLLKTSVIFSLRITTNET